MDRNLALEFVRATEDAAIASAKWLGKGDKHSADRVATEGMRSRLNKINIDGRIVIGEGERDKAPMLYIGEKVGTKNGPKIDFAVDPLECTNAVAYGQPNAISVLAAAPGGHLLHAPDIYMEKLAVGPEAKGKVDLDWPIEKNIQAVAKALGKDIGEVTVVVLKRERHEKLIEKIRKTGARIYLIPDGDVAGAIAPSLPESGIDMLANIGAAPEGVIAAAAVNCLGGEFQGRLWFQDYYGTKTLKKGITRSQEMGVKDINKKFTGEELASGGKVMFAATGISDNPILRGVRYTRDNVITHSIVMRQKTSTVRFIETYHPT